MNIKQKKKNTKLNFTVAVIPSMEYKFHCYVIKSERQNQNVTIPHLRSLATFQPGQNENTEQGHMTLLTLAAPSNNDL